MIDIESRVVDCLKADADQAIKVDGLHAAAVARAGAIRRRRRAFGAVAGVAAVVAGGFVAAPQFSHGGRANQPKLVVGAGVKAPNNRRVSVPTTLPFADVPPAAERPASVGTDAGVLHFDVDIAALGAETSDWTSGTGFEKLSIPTKSGLARYEVIIGGKAADVDAQRDSAGFAIVNGARRRVEDAGLARAVTVNGRPGTLQRIAVKGALADQPDGRFSWVLRWQPLDGLHALVQVFDADQAQAFKAAGAMRLDRAQRCAVPLTFAHPLAGLRLTECRTAIRRAPLPGRGVWMLSSVAFDKPGGERVSVWAEERTKRAPHDLAQFKPNRTIDGHRAQWRTADPHGLWALDFGGVELFVSAQAESAATSTITGLTIAGDLAHPETWPVRPVG